MAQQRSSPDTDAPDEPKLEPTSSVAREGGRQSENQLQITSQGFGSKDAAAASSSEEILPSSRPRFVRASVNPSLMPPSTDQGESEDDVINDVADSASREEHEQQQCVRDLIGKAVDRLFGILEIPLILVFGIVLYLMDIASDIWAAVAYFQEGHQIWGSLTVSFVILSALSWAAVSWSWWYYDHDEDRRPTYRRLRMMLAVLLLDPLVR